MRADIFLSRLEKVRRTGAGTWLACCPAHADRSPSLSVRETDDGRVLVKCFAECSVESILSSVGMTFDDLFPERFPVEQQFKPLRRPFPAADVLAAVAFEASLVAVAASNIRNGIALSDADHERLWKAVERIESARSLALG